MGTKISQTSPLSLLAQMEQNLRLYITYLAERSPSFEVVKEEDCLTILSCIASSHFNLVFDTRFTPNHVEARISEVIRRYEERNLPFTWWVGPSDTPPNLGSVLLKRGFEEDGHCVGMVCTPNDDPRPDLSGLTVVQAHDRDALSAFNTIQVASDVHPDAFEHCYGAVPEEAYAQSAPFRIYLGIKDQEVVTGGIVVNEAQVTGIYKMATIPSARNRGYATALMRVLMRQAWEQKSDAVVLQASPMGVPLYEKLGFQRLAHWQAYTCLN